MSREHSNGARGKRRHTRTTVAISRGERRLLATVRGTTPYLGPILQVLGALALGYAWIRFRAWSQNLEPVDLAKSTDPLAQFAFTSAAWPLWAGTVLSMAGPIISAVRTRSNEKLTSDVATLTSLHGELEESYGDLMDRHLEALQKLVDQELWRLYADQMERSNDRRVSVYRHTGNAFAMVSRCSIHPEYRERGRTAYPDEGGVIGLAWSQGLAELADLPDPTVETDAYYQQLERQGLDREIAEDIGMKSRHLIGIALEDRQNRRRVGVLIAESVQENDLNLSAIQSRISSIQETLNDYLTARSSLDLSIAHARKEGF